MSDTHISHELDNESTSDTTSANAQGEVELNTAGEGNKMSTENAVSKFAPTDLVVQSNVTLEDVKSESIPTCSGRGRETAAVRGYNAERLAHSVFDPSCFYFSISSQPWYDTYASGGGGVSLQIESKSCVSRYPSGPYGRFRIWKHHHDKLIKKHNSTEIFRRLYFFVVYTTTPETVKEVGKLVAPPVQVDEALDKWTVRDHPTMGERQARDISWNLLLKRLGVPKSVFQELPIVDLTEGVRSTSSND